MKATKAVVAVAAVAISALLWVASSTRLAADGAPSDGDDIEGVVTGATGPDGELLTEYERSR